MIELVMRVGVVFIWECRICSFCSYHIWFGDQVHVCLGMDDSAQLLLGYVMETLGSDSGGEGAPFPR